MVCMHATVCSVEECSLLVCNRENSQEVIVHTRNARCFSEGDEICIRFSGVMTMSLPPQITATCISFRSSSRSCRSENSCSSNRSCRSEDFDSCSSNCSCRSEDSDSCSSNSSCWSDNSDSCSSNSSCCSEDFDSCSSHRSCCSEGSRSCSSRRSSHRHRCMGDRD